MHRKVFSLVLPQFGEFQGAVLNYRHLRSGSSHRKSYDCCVWFQNFEIAICCYYISESWTVLGNEIPYFNFTLGEGVFLLQASVILFRGLVSARHPPGRHPPGRPPPPPRWLLQLTARILLECILVGKYGCHSLSLYQGTSCEKSWIRLTFEQI